MNPLLAIYDAYENGYAALFISGRSLHDLVADDASRVRPLAEALRRELRQRFGMALIRYSMSNGLDWDAAALDTRDRSTIETALKAHRLLDIKADGSEVVQILRGVASLCKAPTEGLTWAVGGPLRFALLLEFAEHLTPGAANSAQTESQFVAAELAHLTGQSLALRTSGNLVLFHGRDGLIDDLVSCALHPVRLAQPGLAEKERFINATLSVYPKARFEPDLDVHGAGNLTTNTPNRGVEVLLRASHRTGEPVTARQLIDKKSRDVVELSEQTLTVLDTSRTDNVALAGRNIERPRQILERYAAALLRGDTSMPSNVLLVGPPGTGKTDLAVLTARAAKASAYQMNSPKSGIVGETERRVRLQQTVLREWVPNIAFTDEITESMPLERSNFDGDSGASRAVTAALLTALSDETRRGRSLLIATTNCPWRIGAAMRSRFTVVPVLHPLKQDFPAIVIAMAKRVSPKAIFNETDPALQAAAELFYEKGANPRHIYGCLGNAMLVRGQLTAETILDAANDLCGMTDRRSAIYADLWALRSCSLRSYLPWAPNPEQYPFPEYLKDVVDPSTGHLDEAKIDRRLKEFADAPNV